ncbi:hypothetical protein EON82_17155 [bacterium]|nr:MAG: hypothetical protein EON82_17155 [bacterium]
MNRRKKRHAQDLEASRERIRLFRIQTEDAEAQRVINAIYDAFEGVDRMQAMSWNDAIVADSYGFQRAEPLFPDTDSTWEELVVASWWVGSSLFGYLDPKALRYYLPPAMIRNLLGDFTVDPEMALYREYGLSAGVVNAEDWDELDAAQVEAVRSYLRLMAERHGSQEQDRPIYWNLALEAWDAFQVNPRS